jgi:F420-0:gamma-glutamyl ligase
MICDKETSGFKVGTGTGIGACPTALVSTQVMDAFGDKTGIGVAAFAIGRAAFAVTRKAETAAVTPVVMVRLLACSFTTI